MAIARREHAVLGQTISHYEILDELGHGAMGSVYKARDTRLDRVLALKVLRSDVANPVRERRFIQEARTASSLNHPNIVTIYEIFHAGESPCIAMEYVEGETLEQRLERGPLDLRQGLEWSIAIADALAKAHEAGIIHRDVKPSNIMITRSGMVKILDFGLAKLLEASDSSDAGERLTLDDRIVGTPPYLSPEQALCEKVDARSDIFSFGAILYEMFTGRRPFERESKLGMLSAVVNDQPKKLRSLARHVPARLEKIVAQCLEKKPADRYLRMEYVKDALEDVLQTDTIDRLLAERGSERSRRLWILGIAGIVLLTMAGAAAVAFWNRRANDLAAGARVLSRITSDEGLTIDPAVSPDGKFIAYASDRGSESLRIWIQPTGGGEPVRLTRHDVDDYEPAFSPDGGTIAFRSEREGGGIYVTSILGGPDRLLVRSGRRPRYSPRGDWIAYWTGFSTGDPTAPGSNRIFIVPVNGGVPKQLAAQFESALLPVWSPDGKYLLFLGAHRTDSPTKAGPLTGANRPAGRSGWWAIDIATGAIVKTEVLAELAKQGLSVWAGAGAGIAPDLWLPGNRIVFSASKAAVNAFRDSLNLWSVPLSGRNWTATGPARQLTSGTAYETYPASAASGDLLFTSADMKTGIWMLPLDANKGKVSGAMKQLTRDAAFHGQPCAALDGSRVVYFSTKSGNMDIWLMDLRTGEERPLTATPYGENAPVISADGATVFYSIYGKREAYLVSSSGGEATKVCENCGTWNISHDATNLAFWYSTAKPVVSIGLLNLPTGRKVELVKHPAYSLYQPQFSPDDRFIAFVAQTGLGHSEVFVAELKKLEPVDSAEWIRITGGDLSVDKPRWSPDGNLMYFTSKRDGFMCIWAQRLDANTKGPVGEAFDVYHFHTSRRSLANVGLGPLEISVARNALVFNLGEITANVWRLSHE